MTAQARSPLDRVGKTPCVSPTLPTGRRQPTSFTAPQQQQELNLIPGKVNLQPATSLSLFFPEPVQTTGTIALGHYSPRLNDSGDHPPFTAMKPRGLGGSSQGSAGLSAARVNWRWRIRSIAPLPVHSEETPHPAKTGRRRLGSAVDSLWITHFVPRRSPPGFRAITPRNVRAIAPKYSGDHPPPNPLA